MLLRNRILIGYGYLLVLLLVGVGGALLVLQHLARGIDTVLDENYASVAAARDMLDALDRHNAASLGALLDDRPTPEKDAEMHAAFEDALARAEGNITLADEETILADVRSAYTEYHDAREALIWSGRLPTLAEYQVATGDAYARARRATPMRGRAEAHRSSWPPTRPRCTRPRRRRGSKRSARRSASRSW